jgi:hypothetical protein
MYSCYILIVIRVDLDKLLPLTWMQGLAITYVISITPYSKQFEQGEDHDLVFARGLTSLISNQALTALNALKASLNIAR